MYEGHGLTTLDEFWLGDLRRMTSPESDYGVMWRNAGCRHPLWRVSYIRDTGEVYAAEQGGMNRIWVLGVVPADEVAPCDERATWYRALDRILGDYADPDVNGGFDLSWVTARLNMREGAR